MCGRYTLTASGDALREEFELTVEPEIEARYNIAPTQEAAIVRATPEGRELSLVRWGLIPSWAKDPSIGNRMINARTETVAEKPAFRAAFKRRRCLVLADGFYEWQKQPDGSKQPFYLHLKGHQPFAIAGLWERWRGRDSSEPALESFTLITTEANALAAQVHHRMPVILGREQRARWLDPDWSDRAPLEELLQPYDPAAMEIYPVSRLVNSPRNDSPRCIEPVNPVASQLSF